MRQRIVNYIVTALVAGGISCLTGIAVNAEWKRHKAEKALSAANLKCAIYEFCNYMDKGTIKILEKELEELKSKEKA